MATKTKTTKKAASKKSRTSAKSSKKSVADKAAASTSMNTAIEKAMKNNGKRNIYRVPTTKAMVQQLIAMWKLHWRPIAAVTALYGAFYFIVVSGITAIDVDQLTSFIEETFGAEINSVGTSIILTGAIFGLSSEFSQVSGLLTTFLFIVNSLAMIWVLRHIWLKKAVSVKDAYYQGMYPLIPFLLILGVMFLQIIPFTAGSYIMSTIFANEIAVSLFEKGLVVGFFIFSLLVSAYLLTGSLLSLYLVTIPDMTPMRALRTAKEVLKRRRLLVLQRILVFSIGSLIVAFLTLLAAVILFAPLAPILVTLLAVFALPWGHSFMFILYRHIIED